MARMFPESLDYCDITSQAEKDLYQLFQKQLSDDLAVFHSVKWQVRSLKNGAKDGEADFVLACPKLS